MPSAIIIFNWINLRLKFIIASLPVEVENESLWISFPWKTRVPGTSATKRWSVGSMESLVTVKT